MITSRNSSTNFAGIPVAQTNGFLSRQPEKIILYKISQANDTEFLKKLDLHLNVKFFDDAKYAKVSKDTWSETIKGAIQQILNPKIISCEGFLAVVKNRPCGIMSNTQLPNNGVNLDFLATWPFSRRDTTDKVGISLLNQYFERNKDSSSNSFNFKIHKNENSNCLDFYKSAGFSTVPGSDGKSVMIMKNTLLKENERLNTLLDFQKIKNGNEENLSKILDVGF